MKSLPAAAPVCEPKPFEAKVCWELEDVVTTAELERRPSRAADYRAESEALVALMRHLADSPQTILQRLADAAVRLCRADSAGISIEEKDHGKDIFRWQATAGVMAPFLGGTMPRDFSPCGVTVDRRKTQLMQDPVRFYPYITGLNLPIREVLLVPFFSGEKAVGTVWVVSHSEPPAFDAEDARLISSLAQFASAATEALTAQANAEKARRELEKVGTQLEAALEAGAIATWCWDIVNDQVFADANLARRFSVSETDSKGGPVGAYLQAIHPEDQARVSFHISEAVETGVPYEIEYRLMQADGGYRWVIARGKSLQGADGGASHLSGVVVDITERKNAQLNIERQQRALWAALPVACYTLDADGRLTFFNDAAAKLWDRIPVPGEEMWGGAVALFTLDGAPVPSGSSPAALAVKERRCVRGEEVYVGRADGSRRWVIMHPDLILDSNCVFMGVVIVMFDVTEERLARASLLEARDQAIAASRAKDDFLAALSHELRTPLNPVLLLASDAVQNTDYPPLAREEFETVRRNIELEARLIDDLLDITKITRGVMTLDLSPVDLHSIIKEAAQNVQMDADAKGIAIHWNLDAAHTCVNGDPARLQQVVWNVLKNAVKFTPGGETVRIDSCCTEGGRSIQVSVHDSGIGMDAGEIAKIFDAFVQGHHADKGGGHRFGGLGLGLAISQKVMELHAGKITALSSGRGKGSTFIVEMPLAANNATPYQPGAATLGGSSKVATGLRILIVEDNASTRDALQRLLARRGHKVATAGSGHDACQLAANSVFDLTICDVGLPDMDGHSLLADLHKLRPGLAAIAMTGYGTDSDVARSDRAGFLLHLTKPVSVSRLEEAIAGIVANGALSKSQGNCSGVS